MSAAILESYLAANPDDAALFESAIEQAESSDAAVSAQAYGTLSAIGARAVNNPVVGAMKLGDGKLLERLTGFVQSPAGQFLVSLIGQWLAKKPA